jgi:GTP-binding protein
VRRLRWKGPVYRISALAKQGTEALCRDVMKRLEELAVQEPQEESG